MSEAAETLAAVIAAKPGGESRPGQEAMCAAVDAALASGEHLLVEAPTGVGKSLAYLAPAVAHARSSPDARVVVVTATKGLQEQLTRDDLPTLAVAVPGRPLRFAMLKGRSNYLCRAKPDVPRADGSEARLDFGDDGVTGALEAVQRLAAWAEKAETGDRADAPGAVSDAVWSQVSVDPGECPGAAACHAGDVCFAEAARERAAAAEIVVVNTHLYAAHLGSGGNVLPPHTAVVFDEAHTLEDTFAGAFGVRLTPFRVRRGPPRAPPPRARRPPRPPPPAPARPPAPAARPPPHPPPRRPGRRHRPRARPAAQFRRLGGVEPGPPRAPPGHRRRRPHLGGPAVPRSHSHRHQRHSRHRRPLRPPGAPTGSHAASAGGPRRWAGGRRRRRPRGRRRPERAALRSGRRRRADPARPPGPQPAAPVR